jgi:hypothetical protein
MTYNSVERFVFSNISSTPAAFNLRGGSYGVTALGTWGGGSATLQRLAPVPRWSTPSMLPATVSNYSTFGTAPSKQSHTKAGR